MELDRIKQLAGVNESTDFKLRDMIERLESMVVNNQGHMVEDLIYEWAKTGHCNKRQFKQLLRWLKDTAEGLANL